MYTKVFIAYKCRCNTYEYKHMCINIQAHTVRCECMRYAYVYAGGIYAYMCVKACMYVHTGVYIGVRIYVYTHRHIYVCFVYRYMDYIIDVYKCI